MKALSAPLFLTLVMFCSFSFSQDPASSQPSSAVFTVDSLVFAATIDARSPVGVNTEFQSIEKVSCWTRVTSSQAPTSLKHIWYKDDNKVFELPLTLKPQSGRLWSTKSVSPGNWKVEVVDEGGNVVKSGTFVVK